MNFLLYLWQNREKILMNLASAFWLTYAMLNNIWFPQGLPQPYHNILMSIAFILTTLGYGSQLSGAIEAKVRQIRARRLLKK